MVNFFLCTSVQSCQKGPLLRLRVGWTDLHCSPQAAWVAFTPLGPLRSSTCCFCHIKLRPTDKYSSQLWGSVTLSDSSWHFSTARRCITSRTPLAPAPCGCPLLRHTTQHCEPRLANATCWWGLRPRSVVTGWEEHLVGFDFCLTLLSVFLIIWGT